MRERIKRENVLIIFHHYIIRVHVVRLDKKLEKVKVFINGDYYIYTYMDNENYALSVLQKNPDLAFRIQEQSIRLKQSKINLNDAAAKYTNKYQSEVDEGTKKLQLLLENGKRHGFTEEEILAAQTTFYPTVRTPILNMLFFLVREHPDAADKIQFNRLQTDINKKHNSILNEQNTQYGSYQHDESIEKTAEKAPTMDKFISGNLTHDMFKKIKKLKALSRSPNKQEAFAAYTKCMELCREHNLDFDKIPCNVD